MGGIEMRRRQLLAATAAAATVAAAPAWAHGPAHGTKPSSAAPEQKPWGMAGKARAGLRRIDIRMGDDMRFVPDRIQARRGETVRIVVHNSGRVLHEFVLGTKQELDAHAALMQKFPDMEHDEPWMAHVPAGGQGEIVWHFNRAGEFDFACLIAGHYQAGMVGRVSVAARSAPHFKENP
jgi:uncharacterized cupredoxin-like copper-binding protein